jgi:hypothetical protein
MNVTQQATTSVLSWPKRLLCADDLRCHLTSQRELLLLPKTIITPLAADELKAKGILISWLVQNAKDPSASKRGTWAYTQEKPDVLITSAIQALQRDGITLSALNISGLLLIGARTLAEEIRKGSHCGGIIFCSDPGLVCCVANKIAGLRSVAVFDVTQVVRVSKTLGANLFAIEMPGRTFFEIRQMIKTIVGHAANCPEEVANALRELDGHAHR